MNTRHNYFPLWNSRRLGSANLLLFLLFLGCFFLRCHELNASLRRFSCFGARSHFFEAQRIVPLNAYTQDIEVLMLHCQQKNAYRGRESCFYRRRVCRELSFCNSSVFSFSKRAGIRSDKKFICAAALRLERKPCFYQSRNLRTPVCNAG
jgi:hypothetical protein